MSKLDFSTVLRNLRGEPLQEPKIEKGKAVTQPSLDAQGRPILIGGADRPIPLHEPVMKDITAKDVALAALTAAAVKGEKVPGDEALKRCDVGLRVLAGDALSKEDQVLVKQLVKDLDFGPELKFAFCRFIDEKPQVGEEPAPKQEPEATTPKASRRAVNGDARASA